MIPCSLDREYVINLSRWMEGHEKVLDDGGRRVSRQQRSRNGLAATPAAREMGLVAAQTALQQSHRRLEQQDADPRDAQSKARVGE